MTIFPKLPQQDKIYKSAKHQAWIVKAEFLSAESIITLVKL